MRPLLKYIAICLILFSCDFGDLEFIADLPSSLKETSAIEIVHGSELYWVIEDSGNDNALYGLDLQGKIKKEIEVLNADNIDWEDLTSDFLGNIYIGDFGNNNKKRTQFFIYKISNLNTTKNSVTATKIEFTLPEIMESEDFEAFFEYQGWFYLFSKNHKKTRLIKVPNKKGKHVATFISEFKLKGKHTKVTSADISRDGSTIMLLNHDKIWVLSDFKNDDFFNGTIERFEFKHDSQKEGINILSKNEVIISDEQQKLTGGNLYKYLIIKP